MTCPLLWHDGYHCKIWGSHSGADEYLTLLGCGDVTCCWLCSSRNCEGWWCFHLQGEVLQYQLRLGLFSPKGEGTLIIWNVWNYTPDTVPHPTRTEPPWFSLFMQTFHFLFQRPSWWIRLHAKNSLHIILYSNVYGYIGVTDIYFILYCLLWIHLFCILYHCNWHTVATEDTKLCGQESVPSPLPPTADMERHVKCEESPNALHTEPLTSSLYN
jgi:hypothetical protein